MGKLSVNLCGIELSNPVIPASGTFGYGYEFAELYDINELGSFSFKGILLISLVVLRLSKHDGVAVNGLSDASVELQQGVVPLLTGLGALTQLLGSQNISKTMLTSFVNGFQNLVKIRGDCRSFRE